MFPLDEKGYFCSDDDSHYVETWQFMETLVEKGLVRSIGLSNFNKAQITEVLAIAKVPVSTLQNECHVYLQQKDLIDFSNINLTAYLDPTTGELSTEELTTILQYHVVAGEVPSTAIPATADTLADLTLVFDTSDGVVVNDASVVMADVEASNGVIHVIDTVLIPSE